MATIASVKASLTQSYNNISAKLSDIRKRLSDMGVSNNSGITIESINTDILSIISDTETAQEQNCKVWITSDPLQNFIVNDIAYGNGIYIAVGYINTDGYFAYSYDGLKWALDPTPTPFIFKSICYGNALFIAIPNNSSSSIAKSSNGLIWTTSTTDVIQVNNKIIYAGNSFVIIGNTNVFLTSTDGVTWYQRLAPVTGNWVSIAYNPSKFIAIQNGSMDAAYSVDDGITWLTLTLPSSDTWTEIVSNNDMIFYIVGGASSSLRSNDNGVSWDISTTILSKITYGNNVLIASDAVGTSRYCSYNLGLSWILRSTASTQGALSTLKYIYGKFFMTPISPLGIYSSEALIPVTKESVATNKLFINGYGSKLEYGNLAYSKIFEGWELRSITLVDYWISITYGNGLFVAVATGSTNVMTSPDGINWTRRDSGITSSWQSVTYGNGLFVAVSSGSTNIITSPDGITWTHVNAPISANWYCVTYGNGMFVAMAYGSANAMTSPDGITWTQRTVPVSANWYSVTYGNGMFVAVSANGLLVSSPDGITWTQRTAPVSANWFSITYGNGLFVAVASGSANIMTSPDGITWTLRTAPVSSTWQSITYGNGLFISFAHNTSNIMTSPDGITWTLRTAPVSANYIAICYSNGLLITIINYSGNVLLSGKINACTPDVAYGSFIPSAASRTILCKFKPDKVYIVARGLNIDKKRFCKINISSSDKFLINNVECSTYTIYNNSGAAGLYVTDASNIIFQDGFTCTIPVPELYDGTVTFDYYAVGFKE